jgi:hypothetical protein
VSVPLLECKSSLDTGLSAGAADTRRGLCTLFVAGMYTACLDHAAAYERQEAACARQGAEHYAEVVTRAMQEVAPVLAQELGRSKYEAVRQILQAHLRHKFNGVLVQSRIPKYKDTKGVAGNALVMRKSYGHRPIQRPTKRPHDGACCGDKHCLQEAAVACSSRMCALCCDKRWREEKGASTSAEPACCPWHQPRNKPETLGGLLFDNYEVQVYL